MNIAIVGGRDSNDYDLLKKTLNNFIENKSFLNAIVSGGAEGANSDIVFAFWDGKSRGTLDSITKAKNLEKKLFIIEY